MKKLLIAFSLLSTMSCTENSKVKNFGGTGTLDLAPNTKLVNITWKDTEIWMLTKPMTSTDVAETYEFSEKSSLGIMQGTYIVVETKTK